MAYIIAKLTFLSGHTQERCNLQWENYFNFTPLQVNSSVDHTPRRQWCHRCCHVNGKVKAGIMKMRPHEKSHNNVKASQVKKSIRCSTSTLLRGHLKSSHIADKRKNFHMPLYPLPPSSNESVIDNERNVWQMAFNAKSKCTSKKKTLKSKDHFSRLAKVFTKGRWIFSFFATTCSNMYMYNAIIMSCACRDASLEVQRPLWNEQGDNLKKSKKNTSSTCSFLFLFLHADIAQKRPAGVDIPILSNWS